MDESGSKASGIVRGPEVRKFSFWMSSFAVFSLAYSFIEKYVFHSIWFSFGLGLILFLIWTIWPPVVLYFYYLNTCDKFNDKFEHDKLKNFIDLASKVWAGVLAALGAIYLKS